MAKFEGFGVVIAELENGQEIKCRTTLVAYGSYRKWYEERHPDNIGWYETCVEMNVDEEDVEAKYPDEYEVYDYDIDFQDINIKSIKQILSDIDWEVIE